VVVPVYTPPFGRPANESPSDPLYPRRIDPFVKATDDIICCLLETFDFALGFYILYNGHLQIWASGGDSFDRQLTGSRYPRWFGGLKVSYFTQGPCATASVAEASPQGLISASGSLITDARRPFECGCEIEIRERSQRSGRSRIGVALEMKSLGGRTFITMASHAAFSQSKGRPSLWKSLAKLFFWRNRKCSQASSHSWWDGMEAYKSETDIKVSFVFHLEDLSFLTQLVGQPAQILRRGSVG